jgi:hypothetical protein
LWKFRFLSPPLFRKKGKTPLQIWTETLDFCSTIDECKAKITISNQGFLTVFNRPKFHRPIRIFFQIFKIPSPFVGASFLDRGNKGSWLKWRVCFKVGKTNWIFKKFLKKMTKLTFFKNVLWPQLKFRCCNCKN